MPFFSVTYAYPTDTTRQDEIRPAHLAYLGERIAAGELVVAGPWGAEDAPGGLLIYSVADRDAIQAIVDADPFVQEGVVVSSDIHEWLAIAGPLSDAFKAFPAS
jgi:uncharacterized protein